MSGYRYRMDNPCSSVHNLGKQFAICDEFDFIEKRLKREGIFESFRSVYLWAKFIRYLSSYYRLDDSLKPGFAERFSRDMQEHEKDGWLEQGEFSRGLWRIAEELLKSGEAFHKGRSEDKRRFESLVTSNRILVQYGCGSDGFRLLNYMKKTDCLDRVECLCDSNTRLFENRIFGKQICSLEQVIKRYPEADYLVASVNYGDEIKEGLLKRGIDEKRIIQLAFC